MPVTPNQLLEAAKALRQGDSEVDQRNAASRAYYAAYHRCLPIAKSVGPVDTSKGVHRGLIDSLTNAGPTVLKSISYRLDQCRQLRAEADYEIKIEFTLVDAQTVMDQCERIFDSADQFEQNTREPDRT